MSERRFRLILGPDFQMAALVTVAVLALTVPAYGAKPNSRAKAPAQKQQPARRGAPTSTVAPVAGRSGNTRSLDMKKEGTQLPQSQALAAPTPHSLETVKPPRSNNFYDGAVGKEAEYERILDEEVKTLFRLSQQNSKSVNRGEIWLRLGERYVEKARIIDLREQAEFEKRLKDFADKKTRIRPQINTKASREYNEKAVQLYVWLIKDFPQYRKVDQALFFLGYNHFELGNPQLGEKYYSELVKKYPDSVFISASHFALGEFYFENEKWQPALENYMKVIKVKKARLNTFALYKSAWCLYRLNRIPVALQALERVVYQSRINEREENAPGGRKAVNKLRLAQEALKDYVPFYAEVDSPEKAASDFQRMAGNEKMAMKMLERLAFIYTDTGNRDAATNIFRQLIGFNPAGDRAAEYQYQIVIAHSSQDPKEFRKEFEIWLDAFGPQSSWAKANAANQKLVADVAHLQETTLRNFVLVQHQAAQNARTPYTQKSASDAYIQYFRYFPETQKAVEMRFFHAELLFDMEKHEDAAKLYTWVADKEPKGPFREKAIVNALLALEKDLPSPKEIEVRRGQSLTLMPLDPPVQRFEKAALRYIATFPKGQKTSDIRRRLAVLYYSYNHFDEALALFEQIIKEEPRSENGIIAGNLTLDIYKLKNDMDGLARKGAEFLANPAIASTKFGDEVRVIIAKAGYLRAEKIADTGDSAKAAKEFETFATTNKQSELAAAARYKAAVNYEKAGDLISATRMHNQVMAVPSNDPKIKEAQNDSRNALSRIYQQTGQIEAAARQYQTYAAANPKDPKAVNAYFNAGVLWDALGGTDEAMRAYGIYYSRTDKADRVEVLYAQAEMLNRKGQFTKASYHYNQYLQAGPRKQSHAIHATYMIAHIAESLEQESKARAWFKKVLEIYGTAGKAARNETAKYAAEARFFAAQPTLRELSAVRFGVSEKSQGRAAMQVKALREKYIGEMKEVIRFDNGTYIVAALASTGKMFDSLAEHFGRIQAPSGYKPDEAAKYKELIQGQINGFKNEAKNSYKAAVDKANELEVYTSWTKVAQQGLAGGEGADAGELASDARATDWMGL